jgi:serine/threonine protein kinase
MCTVDMKFDEFIENSTNSNKKYCIRNLYKCGKGVLGNIYRAKLIHPFTKTKIVIKEVKKTSKYVQNEINSLLFLKNKMITGKIPYYYIFMYGEFTEGNYRYTILEQADITLSDLFNKYKLTINNLVTLFQLICDAVNHLEQMKMNHGDLWDHNIMIQWLSPHPSQQNTLDKVTYTIKLIDFDSAFKPRSNINNPSLGGSDVIRSKFYLGYDMNRLIDSIVFKFKRRVIYEHIPIKFQDFLTRLGSKSPDYFILRPNKGMAAKRITEKLKRLD